MDAPLASDPRPSGALGKHGGNDTSWATLGIDTKLGWRSALMDEAEAHLDGRGRAASLDSARAGPYPCQLGQRISSAATDGVRLGSYVSANVQQGSAVTASTLQSRLCTSAGYYYLPTGFRPQEQPRLPQGPDQHRQVLMNSGEQQLQLLSASQRSEQPKSEEGSGRNSSHSADPQRCMDVARLELDEEECIGVAYPANLGAIGKQRQASSKRKGANELLDLLEVGLKSHHLPSASKKATGCSKDNANGEFFGERDKGKIAKKIKDAEKSRDNHKVGEFGPSHPDDQLRCGRSNSVERAEGTRDQNKKPTLKRKQDERDEGASVIHAHSVQRHGGAMNLHDRVKQAHSHGVRLMASGIKSTEREPKVVEGTKKSGVNGVPGRQDKCLESYRVLLLCAGDERFWPSRSSTCICLQTLTLVLWAGARERHSNAQSAALAAEKGEAQGGGAQQGVQGGLKAVAPSAENGALVAVKKAKSKALRSANPEAAAEAGPRDSHADIALAAHHKVEQPWSSKAGKRSKTKHADSKSHDHHSHVALSASTSACTAADGALGERIGYTSSGGAVLLGEPLQLSRGRTGKGADTDCQWVGYVEWNFLCSKIIADDMI